MISKETLNALARAVGDPQEIQRVLREYQEIDTVAQPLSIAVRESMFPQIDDWSQFTRVSTICDDIDEKIQNLEKDWFHQLYQLLEIHDKDYVSHFLKHVGGCVIRFQETEPVKPSEAGESLDDFLKQYRGKYICSEALKKFWFIDFDGAVTEVTQNEAQYTSILASLNTLSPPANSPDQPSRDFVALTYEDDDVIFVQQGYQRTVKIHKNLHTLRAFKIIYACLTKKIFTELKEDGHIAIKNRILEEEAVVGCSAGYDARVQSVIQELFLPKNLDELIFKLRQRLVEDIEKQYDEIHLRTRVSTIASIGFSLPAVNPGDTHVNGYQASGGHDEIVIKKLLEKFQSVLRLYPLVDALTEILKQTLQSLGYCGRRNNYVISEYEKFDSVCKEILLNPYSEEDTCLVSDSDSGDIDIDFIKITSLIRKCVLDRPFFKERDFFIIEKEAIVMRVSDTQDALDFFKYTKFTPEQFLFFLDAFFTEENKNKGFATLDFLNKLLIQTALSGNLECCTYLLSFLSDLEQHISDIIDIDTNGSVASEAVQQYKDVLEVLKEKFKRYDEGAAFQAVPHNAPANQCQPEPSYRWLTAIDKTWFQKKNAFMAAIASGNEELVALFLNVLSPENLNAANEFGWTPLHQVAYLSRSDSDKRALPILEKLLSAGVHASVQLKLNHDKNDHRPSDMARIGSQCCQWLLRMELDEAIRVGEVNEIRHLLLDKGARLDVPDFPVILPPLEIEGFSEFLRNVLEDLKQKAGAINDSDLCTHISAMVSAHQSVTPMDLLKAYSDVFQLIQLVHTYPSRDPEQRRLELEVLHMEIFGTSENHSRQEKFLELLQNIPTLKTAVGNFIISFAELLQATYDINYIEGVGERTALLNAQIIESSIRQCVHELIQEADENKGREYKGTLEQALTCFEPYLKNKATAFYLDSALRTLMTDQVHSYLKKLTIGRIACHQFIDDVYDAFRHYEILKAQPSLRVRLQQWVDDFKSEDKDRKEICLSVLKTLFLETIVPCQSMRDKALKKHHYEEVQSLLERPHPLDPDFMDVLITKLVQLLEDSLKPLDVVEERKANQVVYTITATNACLSDIVERFPKNMQEGSEIRIYVADTLHLDCDLACQGVNIVICALTQILVERDVFKMRTDGHDAIQHTASCATSSDGCETNGHGKPGQDGQDGLPGGPAGNIYVIGRHLPKMELHACGGCGGKGQNGGDGGKGKDGQDGQDANTDVQGAIDAERACRIHQGVEIYRLGTDGTQGYPGGAAGAGGCGGAGGHRGEVTVIDLGLEENTPEKMTIVQQIGQAGDSGAPGKPGEGGYHGRDGFDFIAISNKKGWSPENFFGDSGRDEEIRKKCRLPENIRREHMASRNVVLHNTPFDMPSIAFHEQDQRFSRSENRRANKGQDAHVKHTNQQHVQTIHTVNRQEVYQQAQEFFCAQISGNRPWISSEQLTTVLRGWASHEGMVAAEFTTTVSSAAEKERQAGERALAQCMTAQRNLQEHLNRKEREHNAEQMIEQSQEVLQIQDASTAYIGNSTAPALCYAEPPKKLPMIKDMSLSESMAIYGALSIDNIRAFNEGPSVEKLLSVLSSFTEPAIVSLWEKSLEDHDARACMIQFFETLLDHLSLLPFSQQEFDQFLNIIQKFHCIISPLPHSILHVTLKDFVCSALLGTADVTKRAQWITLLNDLCEPIQNEQAVPVPLKQWIQASNSTEDTHATEIVLCEIVKEIQTAPLRKILSMSLVSMFKPDKNVREGSFSAPSVKRSIQIDENLLPVFFKNLTRAIETEQLTAEQSRQIKHDLSVLRRVDSFKNKETVLWINAAYIATDRLDVEEELQRCQISLDNHPEYTQKLDTFKTHLSGIQEALKGDESKRKEAIWQLVCFPVVPPSPFEELVDIAKENVLMVEEIRSVFHDFQMIYQAHHDEIIALNTSFLDDAKKHEQELRDDVGKKEEADAVKEGIDLFAKFTACRQAFETQCQLIEQRHAYTQCLFALWKEYETCLPEERVARFASVYKTKGNTSLLDLLNPTEDLPYSMRDNLMLNEISHWLTPKVKKAFEQHSPDIFQVLLEQSFSCSEEEQEKVSFLLIDICNLYHTVSDTTLYTKFEQQLRQLHGSDLQQALEALKRTTSRELVGNSPVSRVLNDSGPSEDNRHDAEMAYLEFIKIEQDYPEHTEIKSMREVWERLFQDTRFTTIAERLRLIQVFQIVVSLEKQLITEPDMEEELLSTLAHLRVILREPVCARWLMQLNESFFPIFLNHVISDTLSPILDMAYVENLEGLKNQVLRESHDESSQALIQSMHEQAQLSYCREQLTRLAKQSTEEEKMVLAFFLPHLSVIQSEQNDEDEPVLLLYGKTPEDLYRLLNSAEDKEILLQELKAWITRFQENTIQQQQVMFEELCSSYAMDEAQKKMRLDALSAMQQRSLHHLSNITTLLTAMRASIKEHVLPDKNAFNNLWQCLGWFEDLQAPIQAIQSLPPDGWLQAILVEHVLEKCTLLFPESVIHIYLKEQLSAMDKNILFVLNNVLLDEGLEQIYPDNSQSSLAKVQVLNEETLRNLIDATKHLKYALTPDELKELSSVSLSQWDSLLSMFVFKQQCYECLTHASISKKVQRSLLFYLNGLRTQDGISTESLVSWLKTVVSKDTTEESAACLPTLLQAVAHKTIDWTSLCSITQHPSEQWMQKLEGEKKKQEDALCKESPERTCDEIVDILEKDNPEQRAIFATIRQAAKETQGKYEQIFPEELQRHITELKNIRDNHPAKETEQAVRKDLSMVVPVLLAAWKQAKGQQLKNTQLIALLLGIHKSEHQGLLQQVPTGEGKTLITGMTAAFLALCGRKVDVVSSNDDLAKEGQEKCQSFFDILNLSNDHICHKKEGGGRDDTANKNAYSAQIVYGTVGDFEGDVLKQDYQEEQTYGDRYSKHPKCLLVDEVDNMCLDKANDVLYLSHSLESLKGLESLFVNIWMAVSKTDLPAEEWAEPDKTLQALVCFIKDHIQAGDIFVPPSLQHYVEEKLPRWIKSAFQAKYMTPNTQFRFYEKGRKKDMVIMDQGIGQEQYASRWSEGLMQFLELKYRRSLSEESLKAVFISNVRFFQRYGQDIYGYTGTLGCTSARDFLAKTYHVEMTSLPPLKAKRYTQMPGRVAFSQGEWCAAVADATIQESQKRPVLIICNSIAESEALKKKLEDEGKKVYEYLRDGDNVEQAFKQTGGAKAGDIIIATNKGGRGTDIAVNQDAKGGLHVILTYMPSNLRIEEQAFGRTARNGALGSGQFIISVDPNKKVDRETYQDLKGYGADDLIVEIERQARDCEERQQAHYQQQRYLQLQTEEALFENHFIPLKKKLLEKLDGMLPQKKELKSYLAALITNRWAFWLDHKKPKIEAIKNQQEAQELFDDFKKEFEQPWIENDTLKITQDSWLEAFTKDPEEATALGDIFLAMQDYTRAKKCFERSCALGDVTGVANMRLAFCAVNPNSHEVDKKTLRNALKKAQWSLERLMQHKTVCAQIIQGLAAQAGDDITQEISSKDNAYNEQVRDKMTVLDMHLNHLQRSNGKMLKPEDLEPLFLPESGTLTEAQGTQAKASAQSLYQALITARIIQGDKLKRAFKKKDGTKGHERASMEESIRRQSWADPAKVIEVLDQSALDHLFKSSDFQNIIWTNAGLWKALQCQEHAETVWMLCDEEIIKKDPDYAQYQALMTEIGLEAQNVNLSLFDGEQKQALKKWLEEKNYLSQTYRVSIKTFKDALQDNKLETSLYGSARCQDTELKVYLGALVETAEKSQAYIYQHELPFVQDEKAASEALFMFLKGQHILKCGGLDKREYKTGNPKEALETVFDHAELSPYRAYRDKIIAQLLPLQGEVRQFDRLKANLKNYEQLDDCQVIPDSLPFFTGLGLHRVLILEEFKESSFDWRILVVGIIGALQIIAGSVLMSMGAVNIGGALISMGVESILFATMAAMSGQFSWEAWGIQQAIGFAVAILTAGIQALATVGKTAQQIANLSKMAVFIKTMAKAALDVSMTLAANAITEQVMQLVLAQVIDKLVQEITEHLLSDLNARLKARLDHEYQNSTDDAQFETRCQEINYKMAELFASRAFIHEASVEQLRKQVGRALSQNIQKVTDGMNRATSGYAKCAAAGLKAAYITNQVYTCVQGCVSIAQLSNEIHATLDVPQTSQMNLRPVDQEKVKLKHEVAQATFNEKLSSQLKIKLTQVLQSTLKQGLTTLATHSFEMASQAVRNRCNPSVKPDRLVENPFAQAARKKRQLQERHDLVAHIPNSTKPLSTVDAKALATAKGRNIYIYQPNGKPIVLKPRTLPGKMKAFFKPSARIHYKPGENGGPGHFSVPGKDFQQAAGNMDCLVMAYRTSLGKTATEAKSKAYRSCIQNTARKDMAYYANKQDKYTQQKQYLRGGIDSTGSNSVSQRERRRVKHERTQMALCDHDDTIRDPNRLNEKLASKAKEYLDYTQERTEEVPRARGASIIAVGYDPNGRPRKYQYGVSKGARDREEQRQVHEQYQSEVDRMHPGRQIKQYEKYDEQNCGESHVEARSYNFFKPGTRAAAYRIKDIQGDRSKPRPKPIPPCDNCKQRVGVVVTKGVDGDTVIGHYPGPEPEHGPRPLVKFS